MLTNFGYVIENVLAASGHPERGGDCVGALCDMRNRGIEAIVSLDESGIPLYLVAEHGFDYLHLPVEDFQAPSLDQAREFVEFVRAHRRKGRPVLVHCQGGYGRTGTMLACYLVSEGKTAAEAIAEVRRRRPGSIETEDQEAFVEEFEKNQAPDGKPPWRRKRKP